MEGTHQQVDVTPCSTKQEETEAFKVVSLLHSIVRGVPLVRVEVGSDEGRTDTLKWCPPLYQYGDKQL